jgi:hypothetical protein
VIAPSDVAAAAVSLFNGAPLSGQVPGGLRSGRQAENPQRPYAVVEARPGPRPVQYYTEGSGPGSPYLAWFTAQVTLYGTGEKATGELLKAIDAALAADGWPVPGARASYTYPADGSPSLEQDPDRKQGEDVWRGKLAYEVAVSAAR